MAGHCRSGAVGRNEGGPGAAGPTPKLSDPEAARRVPLLAHFKIVDTLSDMLAALMGYRGCGKTTIGKRLADRLWARFVDIDDLIVRAAGSQSADRERHYRHKHGEG